MVSFDHREPGTPERAWADSKQLRAVPELDLAGVDRAVVFAAHPDDETLGAGGIVHRLVRAGTSVRVIVATLGEKSHPNSPTHTRESLSQVRHQEMADAVDVITAGSSVPEYLALPDGGLTAGALADPVSEAVAWAAQGRQPLAVVTWVEDGHPDHEILAAQVQWAAGAAAVRCVQYPIWWWHWGAPNKLPRGLVHVPLADEDRDAKRQALEHHVSQVRPLSEQPGDEVLLGPHILEHFGRDREYFILSAPHQTPVFNRVHSESEDPWNVDSSRYEHRKRDVLTASLPRELYPRALDIGCSTGALTAQLAAHVGVLTAVDASDVALGKARARLAERGLENVQLRHAVLPGQWDPAWTELDLIVVSEVGYFCSAEQWNELLSLCTTALSPEGHLVLCHWRHPIKDWPLDGDDVHREARRRRNLTRLVAHREEDFEIDIYARTKRGRS